MPRLFFALWPDDTQRGELHAAAQRAHSKSGGRLMRRENLHLREHDKSELAHYAAGCADVEYDFP